MNNKRLTFNVKKRKMIVWHQNTSVWRYCFKGDIGNIERIFVYIFNHAQRKISFDEILKSAGVAPSLKHRKAAKQRNIDCFQTWPIGELIKKRLIKAKMPLDWIDTFFEISDDHIRMSSP